MERVPLERRSIARLVLGLVVTVLVPVGGACALIGYCVARGGDSFVSFVSHFPLL